MDRIKCHAKFKSGSSSKGGGMTDLKTGCLPQYCRKVANATSLF